MYKEKERSRRPGGAAGGQAAMAGRTAPAPEAQSSALGARRSALGARRSALGARRSALGARRSTISSLTPDNRATVKPIVAPLRTRTPLRQRRPCGGAGRRRRMIDDMQESGKTQRFLSKKQKIISMDDSCFVSGAALRPSPGGGAGARRARIPTRASKRRRFDGADSGGGAAPSMAQAMTAPTVSAASTGCVRSR